MPNITFDTIGDCKVLVMGKESPVETEWTAYLRFVQNWVATSPPTARFCVLVFTDGSIPTGVQRQSLNALILPIQVRTRVAVLAGTAAARSVVTALSWFNPVYKAFSHVEIDAALGWLGVSGSQAAEVRKLLERLRKRLQSTIEWLPST